MTTASYFRNRSCHSWGGKNDNDMYIKKELSMTKQDDKGQHLKDGEDASRKKKIFSHQVPQGSADSLRLSPAAINPPFLLAICLFFS